MLKRSLNSFMNAMTASDWTLYPFSSMNRKDFHNLLDIYLDAAFYPRLTERDFSQEGHRLEYAVGDDSTSPLEYKGVVYNEMKGAMSDPSSLLTQRLDKHLYPTTTYRHNSGGEPADIPTLSRQQLRDFHARYYHPSNSWFFLSGSSCPFSKGVKDNLGSLNHRQGKEEYASLSQFAFYPYPSTMRRNNVFYDRQPQTRSSECLLAAIYPSEPFEYHLKILL